MIDQMSDFIKGRTTVTSRIEKVESLEPPTVTICLNPPYKPSKLISFGLDEINILLLDVYGKELFRNQTAEEILDLFGYKLGRDFRINMQLFYHAPDEIGEFWNISGAILSCLSVSYGFPII